MKTKQRETETIVIIREECEVCEGTGLIQMDGRTFDCDKCQGHGMNQVSKRKEITYE